MAFQVCVGNLAPHFDFVDHEDHEEHEGFGKFVLKLRALRTTMLESFRGLRKFFSLPILTCRIYEKIRSHHEAHEGHEGFGYLYS